MFFAPFLFFYGVFFFVILAFLFALIEIHVISYAFEAVGLPPEVAFLALMASLIGSYINIPIARLDGGGTHPVEIVNSFGVRYRVPHHLAAGSTTVAINVGGAIVPIGISIYVLLHNPVAILPSAIGVAIVALVVHRFARPVEGLGIAVPMFIPPVVAALAGYFLGGYVLATPECRDVVAFVSGVAGALIGADLANLGKLKDLGAPVASIGGAGTFDGIFLTGIVAVLLA